MLGRGFVLVQLGYVFRGCGVCKRDVLGSIERPCNIVDLEST